MSQNAYHEFNTRPFDPLTIPICARLNAMLKALILVSVREKDSPQTLFHHLKMVSKRTEDYCAPLQGKARSTKILKPSLVTPT